MAQMKMLRQVMSPADIYSHADTICDMLRDHYGSYDADSLDEVMVEDTFIQRLAAKGYDLLPEGAEVDDRPMAPPPSRREVPRAEISQLPPRRPAQNGSGGLPLRRREPAGDSDSPVPLRTEGGLPLRRGPSAGDGDTLVRRGPPAGDATRGMPLRRRPGDNEAAGPIRRRPATGEGENIALPRRRPMGNGDVGLPRPRPEGTVTPERAPRPEGLAPERASLPRTEAPLESRRPSSEPQATPEPQVASERLGSPASQVTAAPQAEAPGGQLPSSPQVMPPAAEQAPESARPEASAPIVEAAAPAPAVEEAKPAPRPRARRSTRAKLTLPEGGDPQGQS